MNSTFMRLAIQTAFRSDSKFRLGAVLVKKNRVLSVGWNQMKKTHTRQQAFCQKPNAVLGVHAELHALIGVSKKDLENSSIYVARVLKSGEEALAKPCESCRALLQSSNIKNVFYTRGGGRFQKERL